MSAPSRLTRPGSSRSIGAASSRRICDSTTGPVALCGGVRLVVVLRSHHAQPDHVSVAAGRAACRCRAAVLPSRTGLGATALLLYLAFVLDCTDGQLARLRGQTSSVGSYLDFLMDEIKAVALIAAVAGRLALDRSLVPGLATLAAQVPSLPLLPDARLLWLGLGLAGVVIAASGISITTFMRRQEYFEAVHGKPAEKVPGFTALRAAESTPAPRPSPVKRLLLLPVRILEMARQADAALSGVVLHSRPARSHWWFLLPYLAAHTMYLGRSALIVLFHLGQTGPAAGPGSVIMQRRALLRLGLSATATSLASALPAVAAWPPRT